MSSQDIPSNGDDFVPQMDQLKLDDGERLGPDGEPAPKTEEEYAQAQLTLRAIVSSKEAGVIIGKGGKNVADLRDETGVKAGVSKVVQGVHDRVLTITGGCEAISRAYAIVAQALLEGAPSLGMGGVPQSNGTHPIKLLISHNQMGTIIGRQGLKIKHIQDVSGVRMVAQKEMLPQSTERIVEVQGTPDGIRAAIWEISKCLVDDWQRGTGTVLYNPVVRTQPGSTPAVGGTSPSYPSTGGGRSQEYSSPRVLRTGNGADFSSNGGGQRPYSRRSDSDAASRGPPTHDENGEELQTQNISIPADMVGCIIGRAGSKISEIRKTSGARISIAKAPHDETGERMFTIMGTSKANESALFLLYENLEAEKMRRSQAQTSEAISRSDLPRGCPICLIGSAEIIRRHDFSLNSSPTDLLTLSNTKPYSWPHSLVPAPEARFPSTGPSFPDRIEPRPPPSVIHRPFLFMAALVTAATSPQPDSTTDPRRCTEDRHSAGYRYSLPEEQFDFAGLCGTFSLTT
ncbi:Poly(rC)-binding protein [Verticillium dahliae VdLs.17]|uniref:Poly(RC)-binding protein n=3 Tax=Verticillium TaxID=1036719 RepID=G2X7N7_VERDV|nr:Poly(rC)-binding protein [Verticillium dahliae VdLs.17]EGY15005.1 Poly(rC)-binding protein [Verticillium dahliae VdLs.17]KAH6694538.1 poly-binding protein [Verticillium dahliae]